MSKRKTQFNNQCVNENDQPSCFIVDLKKQIEEDEEKQFFCSWVHGQADKQIKQIKDKVKAFYNSLQGIGQSAMRFIRRPEPLMTLRKLENLYLEYQYKLNRLAFFFLFKYFILFFAVILKRLYRLCYRVGWLAVFLVRFILFASLAVTGQIKQIIIKLRKKLLNIKKFNLYFSPIKNKNIIAHQLFGAVEPLEQRVIFRNLPPHSLRSFCSRMTKWIFSHSKDKENKIIKGKDLLPQPKHYSLRSVLSFAVILFILILPFKAFTYYKSINGLRGKVLGASEAAVSEFLKAGELAAELNFGQAGKDFSSAGDNFLEAQSELDDINGLLFVLASLAPDKKLKLASNAKHILVAGEKAADLGSSLSMALDGLFSEDKDLIGILDDFSKHGRQAIVYAKDLKAQLEQINVEDLPVKYQQQFILIQEKSRVLEKSLTDVVDLIPEIKVFLGVNQDKRYLLIFQNNTELRASGGFIGSYALIDFRKGKIKNIEIPGGGSYDTEAGLHTMVTAPKPLHLVNPLWHFWDANWWPDWPKSAKKLMWFYEKSNGPTVDGVISFTPTVIERILSVIGPIDMTEKYGVIIDADNFWLTVQRIVEQEPEKAPEDSTNSNTPKKIIGDLMEKIIDELPVRLNKTRHSTVGQNTVGQNKDIFIKLIKAIQKSLNEKHILFYFTDDQLEKKVSDLGWDGKIKQSSLDYLAVINTNIAGGKSDKKIKEVINHRAEILADGSIVNTLEIKRTHTGVKRELFCGVRNVDWMRIYVPLGSELIEARGFKKPDDIYFEKPDSSWLNDDDLYMEEVIAKTHWPSGTKIYEESWKTVFANWTMVDPEETITVYLKYKLPFKLEKNKKSYNIIEKVEDYLKPNQEPLFPYAILIQKQSGAQASLINSSLKLADNFNIIWRYPAELNANTDGWQINDSLDIDKYWAVLLESKN